MEIEQLVAQIEEMAIASIQSLDSIRHPLISGSGISLNYSNSHSVRPSRTQAEPQQIAHGPMEPFARGSTSTSRIQGELK